MSDLNADQTLVLNALISKCELDLFQEQILRLAKPCLRILPDLPFDGKKIGSTHIGGTPDLPKGVKWPQIEGKYLVFLAQINLEEMSFADAAKAPQSIQQPSLFDLSTIECRKPEYDLLPKNGMLFFFLGSTTDYYNVQHQVIYVPNGQTLLKRTQRPSLDQFVNTNRGTYFPPFVVTTQLGMSLPSFGWRRLNTNTFDEELHWKYAYLESAIEHHQSSKLLGYAYPPDYRICWNLFAREKPNSRYDTSFEIEYYQNWLLLFELYSHEETEMYWGDSGCLYFMIHRDDLINRNFNRTFAAGFSH
jgi:uncharacterized protein YwqG